MEKRSERFVSIGMIVNLPIAQQQLRPSVMVGSIRGTESLFEHRFLSEAQGVFVSSGEGSVGGLTPHSRVRSPPTTGKGLIVTIMAYLSGKILAHGCKVYRKVRHLIEYWN